MTAFAYIDIADVPTHLRETSAQRIDSLTGATLIAFEGCPLIGQSEPEKPQQIEFPFPRLQAIRCSWSSGCRITGSTSRSCSDVPQAKTKYRN